MQPPQVRTLDQLTAESNPVYEAQRQANAQKIAGANSRLGEQEQGLNAAQTNAFGQITQAAASRGALFSGFTPDQQARYTSEKYLPALANLRAANESTIQGINQNTLDLNMQQNKDALSVREGDLSRLYDYNKTQDDRKFQTEQANQAYEREMAKLREEQKFTASQNAQNRAASANGGVSDAARMRGDVGAVGSNLAKMMGGDNFVSPTVWAQQKAAWMAQGWSAADFDKNFSGYKNPKNPWYK
jgi:hypothetical protein